MKVTLEGTNDEFLNLAELLAYGRDFRRTLGASQNKDASQRNMGTVQAGDDVPNRAREEGVDW